MKNKKEQIQEEQLPTVLEVIEELMTPGTVLKYPEKEIILHNSPQSAIKSLKVNILSAESQDMAILHKLHSKTRSA